MTLTQCSSLPLGIIWLLVNLVSDLGLLAPNERKVISKEHSPTRGDIIVRHMNSHRLWNWSHNVIGAISSQRTHLNLKWFQFCRNFYVAKYVGLLWLQLTWRFCFTKNNVQVIFQHPIYSEARLVATQILDPICKYKNLPNNWNSFPQIFCNK